MIQVCSKQTYPNTQHQDYWFGWTMQQREPQRFKFEASGEQSCNTSFALLGGTSCLCSSMRRHQWKPWSTLQAGWAIGSKCIEHRAAFKLSSQFELVRPGCLQAGAGLALLNSKSKSLRRKAKEQHSFSCFKYVHKGVTWQVWMDVPALSPDHYLSFQTNTKLFFHKAGRTSGHHLEAGACHFCINCSENLRQGLGTFPPRTGQKFIPLNQEPLRYRILSSETLLHVTLLEARGLD